MSADFLAEAAGRWPGRRALSDEARVWTYADLDAWVSELAERIRAEDAPGPADVFAVEASATPEGIATLFAALRLELTVAPLHPGLTEPERAAARRALAGPRPAGVAVLWTSGTSGRPRGVVLTAENLRASALAVATRLDLGPEDRWLASLSPAHVGGLALLTRAVLLGSEVVADGPFDAERTWALLDGGRVTHASFVPTQLLRLLDAREGRAPPPSFRCALIGGAHASAALVARALDEGWPLALTYGMTEMTSQVATAPPELVRRKPGTAGAPLDGVEISVADDGELRVRGPTLAGGVVGSSGPLSDGDGWYSTGDLGHLDEEGHLWVTGRRSARIISGGVNVDPAEVEAVLREHPTVVDACVVGVPDAEWGEKVCAAVVPVEGELDPAALDGYVRERLAAAKRPRRWRLLDALPLNANGKVDRVAVRAGFEG